MKKKTETKNGVCKICKKKEAVDIHHKDENHKNNAKKNLQPVCTLCHAKIHGISPKKSEMRRLVTLYTRTVKARIAIEHQVRAFGNIEMVVPKYFLELQQSLDKKCDEYEKEIKNLLKSGDYPIWDWLKSVKGVSHLLSAKLIAYIDIANTPTVSALWSYCGQAPGQRLKKGQKANWNPDLKSYVYQLGDSFVKQSKKKDSIYGKAYVESKKMYEQREDLNKCQRHRYAMKRARKLFLSHLWETWRKLENLPVTEPYILGKGHHEHKIEVKCRVDNK